MTRQRAWVWAGLVLLAGLIITGSCESGASASGPACPAGMTCTTRMLVTDGAPNLDWAFYIEDNEGFPPGHNAEMFRVDGLEAGSTNPVCSRATHPYVAHEACLGGIPGRLTNGGHPLLSLCLVMGRYDCAQWVTLTAGDIAWLHRMERLMSPGRHA